MNKIIVVLLLTIGCVSCKTSEKEITFLFLTLLMIKTFQKKINV